MGVGGCQYEGTYYNDGDGFPSADGCNTWYDFIDNLLEQCIHRRYLASVITVAWAVRKYTARLRQRLPLLQVSVCLEQIELNSWVLEGCLYGGKRYEDGDRFLSTDGCNRWYDIILLNGINNEIYSFCAGGNVGCTKKFCRPSNKRRLS